MIAFLQSKTFCLFQKVKRDHIVISLAIAILLLIFVVLRIYIKKMENQNLSNRLTYLTLASAGIGFAAYTLHPLLIGLFFLILIIPKYYPF